MNPSSTEELNLTHLSVTKIAEESPALKAERNYERDDSNNHHLSMTGMSNGNGELTPSNGLHGRNQKKPPNYYPVPVSEDVNDKPNTPLTMNRTTKLVSFTILFLVILQVILTLFINHVQHKNDNSIPSVVSTTKNDARPYSFSGTVSSYLLKTSYSPLPVVSPLGGNESPEMGSKGLKWEVWDGNSIIQPATHPNQPCRWTTFRPPGSSQAIPMCVHPQKDIISDKISQMGYWGHCMQLIDLWEEGVSHVESFPGSDNASILNNIRSKNPKKGDSHVFVDVGANIGACSLLVLLTKPNSQIIAFEPNPDNLFCFTSTLMNLDPSLRSRVIIYPIALGNEQNTAISNEKNPNDMVVIYGEHDNMGNSVIGKMVGTQSMNIHGAIPIAMARMDNIITGKKKRIPLIKIDTQGYECQVLWGMNELFPSVDTIVLEVHPTFLNEFQCNLQKIFSTFKKNDYSLYLNGGQQGLKEITGPHDVLGFDQFDVVARRNYS